MKSNGDGNSSSSSSNREQRVNKRFPTMFEKIRSKIVVKIGILKLCLSSAALESLRISNLKIHH